MSRYIQPVCKRCRRFGVKLFLKGDKCASDKCPLQKRAYIPGQHGPTGRRIKITDYGTHLFEKQKAKFYFGVTEEQFRRYFDQASRQRKIPTGDKLIQILEKRLDNVLYRAGIGVSLQMSRQFVLHNKVYVNGRSVNIPSYSVRVGDKITFKESLKNNIYANYSLKERNISPPSWMSVDKDKWGIEILNEPSREDFSVPFNEQLIVEFYSK